MDDIQGDPRPEVFLDAHAWGYGDLLCFLYLNQHSAEFTRIAVQRDDVDVTEEPRGIQFLLRGQDLFGIVPVHVLVKSARPLDDVWVRARIAGHQDSFDLISTTFRYPVG